MLRKLASYDFKFAASYVLGGVTPGFFRNQYIKKTIKSGIKEKYFILSFDCDTEKDIEVVEDVHMRLNKYGITPSYAVPGELLKLGRDVYSNLNNKGVEFINHGYLSHTSYNAKDKSYLSTLFYDQLSNEMIKRDVIKGHNNFIDVFGENPKGFRTPHFGTYQKKNQLKFLYSVLNDLDYSFSSSTTPVTGMWKGAMQKQTSGILEFPVSGSYDYPARILDSWGYRFSPTRKLNENDYVEQLKKMMNFFADPNTSGIFNIYADPSQVYDWNAFFECMDMTSGLINTSFSDLIKEVEL